MPCHVAINGLGRIGGHSGCLRLRSQGGAQHKRHSCARPGAGVCVHSCTCMHTSTQLTDCSPHKHPHPTRTQAAWLPASHGSGRRSSRWCRCAGRALLERRACWRFCLAQQILSLGRTPAHGESLTLKQQHRHSHRTAQHFPRETCAAAGRFPRNLHLQSGCQHFRRREAARAPITSMPP